MNILLLVLTTGAAATATLACVGRLSFELRARVAMRTVRARGDATELAELRRRMFEAQ